MFATRIESDTFGLLDVAAEHWWGAQTQRSLEHFNISCERMPDELILALAAVKRACARVNGDLQLLPAATAAAIAHAADSILAGQHQQEFPLMVWQSGSGTQTHMNMNEVLANLASVQLGGVAGSERCVHAHDEVNLGQSSNDIFPTAMHLAAASALSGRLLPALYQLQRTLTDKSTEYADIIKIGRTHLQDATPLTLGQEFSGYVAQLDHAQGNIRGALPALCDLAIGGTAVGTGLNSTVAFGERVAADLALSSGLPLRSAANKFAALAAHDAMVAAHGTLKTLATALMKIANDIRWLASGPRCGLGELILPENEPGSSIMPGKVNPTQCEALTMVCCQVLGNDVALTIGGALGNFELNVFKPLIAYNFLQSARLLADGMVSFEAYCARGIKPNRKHIGDMVERSLMLVTALTPHIGYDRAAMISKQAHRDGCTLRQAALALGYVAEHEFDLWVQPEDMVHPGMKRQAPE